MIKVKYEAKEIDDGIKENVKIKARGTTEWEMGLFIARMIITLKQNSDLDDKGIKSLIKDAVEVIEEGEKING